MSDPEQYVKLTTFNCIHNGYEFKEGLNTDCLPFNTKEECCAGGIYFCKFKHILHWLIYSGKEMYWIWDVKIPFNEGNIKHYDTKSKSDSIILSNKRAIRDLNNWNDLDFQILAVNHDPMYIKYIKNPNEEIQLRAIDSHPYSIRYIENPTENIQMATLKRNGGYYYNFITNPTVKVQSLYYQMMYSYNE